jgi:uncharacterized protein YukE
MDGSGKSFVDALEAAKTAGWGANEMMSAFGMRGGRAALVLKDLIPMIKDLEHKLKNSEGEAKKLAETMRSSTRNAFIELQSAVEGIAIDAFSKDTGSLNEAVRNLTNTVRDSKSTFEDLATLLIKIAGAFVAVGEGAINTYKFLSIAESYGEYNQAIKQVLDDLKKDPRTGDYPGAIDARSVLSEHERRRLGLAVEDEESRKRGPSYDSRAMLTDLWATGKSTPRFNAPSNPALMEFAKIAEIKKHTDIEIKKLDWELIESNHKTVMALTDNWANFYDEQTQKASEASIAKAAAVEELTRGHFDRMKELSERTAWAMQENFSNFFYDAMRGELNSLKDLATSIFDTILKAFSDMVAQMAVQKLFGMLPTVTGGSGSSSIDSFIGDFMHGGGVVGGPSPKKRVPASLFLGAPRLHGGLAPDEFPAILQRGETVIPKSGGGGGMIVNQTINPTIVANDAASFADMTNRNPEAVTAPIMQAIQEGNMPLINAIRGVV